MQSSRSVMRSSLVVRFAAPMVPGAVELFGEHQSRQFMRQRPGSERQPPVRARPHGLRRGHARRRSRRRRPAAARGLLRAARQTAAESSASPPGIAGHQSRRAGHPGEQALPFFRHHLRDERDRADSSFTSMHVERPVARRARLVLGDGLGQRRPRGACRPPAQMHAHRAAPTGLRRRCRAAGAPWRRG